MLDCRRIEFQEVSPSLFLYRVSRTTNVRKSLAEALILLKLNYDSVVFAQIPHYLLQRLQKIQNITAGYVLFRSPTLVDITKLKWLPVSESIDWNTVKLVQKSKIDPEYPVYLKVEFHDPIRNFLSSSREPTVSIGKSKTLQDQARIFDALPENIRKTQSYKLFSKDSKKF